MPGKRRGKEKGGPSRDEGVKTGSEFSGARNISLESYRKNGHPVKTTVWLVEDGGSLYVRTDPRSGKAKRIRRNPKVRIAPSDMRGNVKGGWADGEARFVEGEEAERVLKLFSKKYGSAAALLEVWHRLRKVPPYVVISIRVGAAGPQGTASGTMTFTSPGS